eukprot:COSAG01_NODE_11390_length_1943_cov_2.029778_2_plen_101_part_00
MVPALLVHGRAAAVRAVFIGCESKARTQQPPPPPAMCAMWIVVVRENQHISVLCCIISPKGGERWASPRLCIAPTPAPAPALGLGLGLALQLSKHICWMR